MKDVNEIEVIRRRWHVFYNFNGVYISNLCNMMKCYKVIANETIVFTIDDSKVMYGRIYLEDGKEADYVHRFLAGSAERCKNWVWSLKWKDCGIRL